MADYFGHWLKVGSSLKNPPRICRVNWFRTDDNGKFLWPGFGDNLRVLKWILDRAEGRGKAAETPIGFTPTTDAIDRSDLKVSDEVMSKLLKVDPAEWVEAVAGQEDFLKSFGSRMPQAIWDEHNTLAQRIQDAITPADWRGRSWQ
jgi:phosphoenolpyruvate carboxykinase (GTP)